MPEEIIINPHTLQRAEERGTNRNEMVDVITNGINIPAKHGRNAKAKTYKYGRKWRGRLYSQKRVEVIYVKEGETITTITVYVFYGQWEKDNANTI